jgi:beta-glucosidase
MHRSRCRVVLSVVLWSVYGSAVGASDVELPRDPPFGTGIYDTKVAEEADRILGQMTLEEEVGQTSQYGIGPPENGGAVDEVDYTALIRGGHVGAVLGPDNAKTINAYQRVAVQESRLHIPILFGLDVIHGFHTTFPIPLGLASTWDPSLVEHTARVAAREATASGIRWTFSPMVDISRDARWGRIAESAGEDPYLSSIMAAAFVRGYQGSTLGAPDSMIACAKHFVGYGAAEGGRDYNTTEISEHTLRAVYLPPFKAAVDAGVGCIMSAFNSLNGVPASANHFTLTAILRDEWGFGGIVDSDAAAIAELIEHGIATDGAAAASKAFLAGVDMDMGDDLYRQHLAKLVRSGVISKERLDESVRRILRVKLALGLFTHPYSTQNRESRSMLQDGARELAEEAAERSFVLLKNDSYRDQGPLLPLTGNPWKVALIGPLADDAANMLGTWSDARNRQYVTTLREALRRKIGEDRLLYVAGTGIEDDSGKSDIDAAVAIARDADLVILALGESADMSGEAASRAHLALPGRQEDLLEEVVATGRPTVLVVFSGRPLALPWAFDHVSAVIAAWAPGTEAGPALVRTLYGESIPSGKLVVSWPRSVGQEPLYYNALSTGRPFGVGGLIRFSPRYIDESKAPQFPFGFGLSYTRFEYGKTEVNVKQLVSQALQKSLESNDSTGLTASVTIKNVGSLPGDEIAQLYVCLQGTSVASPMRELKGFQRVLLAPGEARKVTFNLAPEAFASWDIENRFRIDFTKATLWIGANSEQGIPVELEATP